MIASVRGEVLEVALDHVVIEAAGVGYRVNATPATLATLRQGTEARLITAMIVREDSMTLYGFPDGETRDLFLTLLSVSGVGPGWRWRHWPCTTLRRYGRCWPTATSPP